MRDWKYNFQKIPGGNKSASTEWHTVPILIVTETLLRCAISECPVQCIDQVFTAVSVVFIVHWCNAGLKPIGGW